MKYSLLIFMLCLMFSCSKPTVRKPITHNSSTSYFEKSIVYNQELLKQEVTLITKIIEKDTLHNYMASPYGFWYYYNQKNATKKIKAVSGNEVIINYEIRDLDNKILIEEEELGTTNQPNKKDRLLKIDRENFILGLHEGIQLMQLDEVVTFLLPSNKAFGVTGLSNRIAPNQALIIKVKLKSIIK